jgi:hypothetical protein
MIHILKVASAIAVTGLLLSSSPARAVEPAGASAAPLGETAEAPTRENTKVQRPWLYIDDPTVAPPLEVVALTGVSLTTTGPSPTRPFASNVAHPGGAYDVGAEVGIVPRLSIEAIGVTSGVREGKGLGVGMIAGLRVAIVDRESTHLTASAGYLRELEGANGAWGRITFAQDIGRARLAVTAHGEHVFQPARDAVDLMIMAGATFRVVGPLRAGAEYVAQDLEGAIDDEEAEAGVRHFIGPNVALDLLERRLMITAGPALGLSYESPRLVARAALAYAF